MKNINKEEFEEMVKESISKAEVARKMGMNGTGGTSYRYVNSLIRLYDIDTGHLKGQAHLRGKNHNWSNKKPLNEILVENSDYLSSSHLRRRVVKAGLLKYKCYECEIKDWRGKKLSLHLDHINGICNDNRIENLRLLCPNCHSQTKTFGSKNNSNKPGRAQQKESKILSNISYNLNKCIDCKTKIDRKSTRCKSCAGKLRPTKIDWPPTEKLIKMVEESNYSIVSRELGVSDNAIRKRIKNYK